jgi:2-dehydro-3-deoxy-D-arabinonate dehydratase
MKLYRTRDGILIEDRGLFHELRDTSWDDLFNRIGLEGSLTSVTRRVPPLAGKVPAGEVMAPIEGQEVWAAGVTYFRSRTARMEEAQTAGGGDFYDRVYSAERPEIFFKATAHRVAGSGQTVRIRSDSRWNVPEPELAIAINSAGRIIGFTIGNDMSSRDIEGENPLYLPQAKVYDGCCALGPCILITEQPLNPSTEINLKITRGDDLAFEGSTRLAEMKRSLDELIEYLFRDNSFPRGCFLLTGTGIVPPDEFSLSEGDKVQITIEPIGTLINQVALCGSK